MDVMQVHLMRAIIALLEDARSHDISGVSRDTLLREASDKASEVLKIEGKNTKI